MNIKRNRKDYSVIWQLPYCAYLPFQLFDHGLQEHIWMPITVHMPEQDTPQKRDLLPAV